VKIDWSKPPRMAVPEHPDETFHYAEDMSRWSWQDWLGFLAGVLVLTSAFVLIAFLVSVS
jgi:hypothetical protein